MHLISQELSPTNDANLVKSLMNIHESQLDEFMDEQQFKVLELSTDQVDSWIMVYTVSHFAECYHHIFLKLSRAHFSLLWCGPLEAALVLLEDRTITFFSGRSSVDH